MGSRVPNRLAAESSPYLLQHQHNPVDWYPWGEEALAKARDESRPIFLSIGYAACHWCHVMEHESFEDDDTAAYLNEHFVSIKVDREERPDLDQIYMSAVTAITGHGGWPMTVFLMPDGRPFHGGTYFPPEPRYGMPSFLQLLQQVWEAWVIRRDDLENGAQQLAEALQRVQVGASTSDLTEHTLGQASRVLAASHDRQHGGWGAAPKFPQPMALEFLLRRHLATGEGLLLEVVERSLTKMARGGIYDQLGGGFHRYSVDAEWLAPHFEKMLYDNAQLARVYLHAWQVTGQAEYRAVVEATLDYVAREMTHPDGGFFSTQDADSEGEEGKFFVWSVEEVDALLGDDAPLFRDAYDVTRGGNWEGKTILRRVRDADVLAAMHSLTVEEVEARLALGRSTLLERREGRIRPGLDDKVLTAWNGMMLATVADAARVLDRGDYRDMAVRAGEFALRELRRPNGRLWRTWRNGQAKLNGYLEDYACLASGLVELYQTTFDPRWFEAARELADAMLAHFADPAGGFFDTSEDHETLITRPKDVQDNATPSGNAMAATVLAQLAALTGDARFADAVAQGLPLVGRFAGEHATEFGQWLCAADFTLAGAHEVAIVGDLEDPGTRGLIDAAFAVYRPRQVVAAAAPAESTTVPLLVGRPTVDGAATAYVCRNFACELPVTDAAGLTAQLAR